MSRFAFLPFAALLLAAPLSAAPLEVKHADLDLAKSSDAVVMIDRLLVAARPACKRRDGFYDNKLCLAEVVAGTIVTLNAPAVSEAYRTRFGVSPEKVAKP
jgi:UrcA family protein